MRIATIVGYIGLTVGYIILIIMAILVLIFIGLYLYASYNDWKEKQSIKKTKAEIIETKINIVIPIDTKTKEDEKPNEKSS